MIQGELGCTAVHKVRMTKRFLRADSYRKHSCVFDRIDSGYRIFTSYASVFQLFHAVFLKRRSAHVRIKMTGLSGLLRTRICNDKLYAKGDWNITKNIIPVLLYLLPSLRVFNA